MKARRGSRLFFILIYDCSCVHVVLLACYVCIICDGVNRPAVSHIRILISDYILDMFSPLEMQSLRRAL